jgi:uncharacterized protein
MAVPNLWRTKKQRYSLVGDICSNCSRAVFPPREICPHCHKPVQTVAAPVHTNEVAYAFTNVAQPALVAVVGDD